MGSTIVQLIPVMIGAAAVPFGIIFVFLLLRSPDGLFKASAFAGGEILVRLAQGIGFGSELGYSALAQTKEGASGIIHTLLVVAGILMWITVLKSWAKQEDPDAPPARWMAMIGSISRLKAFGLGMVGMACAGRQWILTFYALGVLRVANLPRAHNVVVFMAFILGAESLILLPIMLCALAPGHSSRFLETGTLWFERNNQKVVTVVSVAFGSFFLFKGITGLLQ